MCRVTHVISELGKIFNLKNNQNNPPKNNEQLNNQNFHNSAKLNKFLTPDGSKQSAKMAARKLVNYLSGKEMRDWLTR